MSLRLLVDRLDLGIPETLPTKKRNLLKQPNMRYANSRRNQRYGAAKVKHFLGRLFLFYMSTQYSLCFVKKGKQYSEKEHPSYLFLSYCISIITFQLFSMIFMRPLVTIAFSDKCIFYSIFVCLMDCQLGDRIAKCRHFCRQILIVDALHLFHFFHDVIQLTS